MAQSTAVVKNCVRLAVSTVAFARNLFPKDAFVSKSYGGVTLEVLRPVDQKGAVLHEGAQRVHEWLEKGAFKALDEDYLEKVTFTILDAHPSDPKAKVIESYSFKVAPVPVGKGGKSGALAVAVSKKQNVAGSTVTTTSSKHGLITKDEVHNAMQQLVRTLVMVTSSLDPLPTTRWLSMSITYNDSAPPEYEAPDFCPQDPSLQPKFAGMENVPLVIRVGEVNTGFHNVGLTYRQSVANKDAEDNIACTQQVSNNNNVDGFKESIAADYDSDDTTIQWQRKKEEIVAMAQRIARNAQANGEPVEQAVRSSELAKTLPEDVLTSILTEVKLSSTPVVAEKKKPAQKKDPQQGAPMEQEEPKPMNPPPVPTIVIQKRVSRVKRPLQQIDSTGTSKAPKIVEESTFPSSKQAAVIAPLSGAPVKKNTYSKRA